MRESEKLKINEIIYSKKKGYIVANAVEFAMIEEEDFALIYDLNEVEICDSMDDARDAIENACFDEEHLTCGGAEDFAQEFVVLTFDQNNSDNPEDWGWTPHDVKPFGFGDCGEFGIRCG